VSKKKNRRQHSTQTQKKSGPEMNQPIVLHTSEGVKDNSVTLRVNPEEIIRTTREQAGMFAGMKIYESDLVDGGMSLTEELKGELLKEMGAHSAQELANAVTGPNGSYGLFQQQPGVWQQGSHTGGLQGSSDLITNALDLHRKEIDRQSVLIGQLQDQIHNLIVTIGDLNRRIYALENKPIAKKKRGAPSVPPPPVVDPQDPTFYLNEFPD